MVDETKKIAFWVIAVPIIMWAGVGLYIVAVQSFESLTPLCRVEQITYKDSQQVD